MRLDHLVAVLPGVKRGDGCSATLRAAEITAVTADSRQVQPGALFVAYQGLSVDGHDFIQTALAKGALAVVGEKEPGQLEAVEGLSAATYIQVTDGRDALAHLAAAWHGFPARRLKMIGVTGTDGKTTVASLIHALLTAAGHRAGLISTVGARIGEERIETGLHTTTPDAPDVQALLAQMVGEGSEYGILESTSHGLAQRRVAACDFDVAVVTNITHEHLDFHGSYEAYAAAKALLFQDLSRSARKPGTRKVAVLNRDDGSYERLLGIPADVHISYGLSRAADVRAVDIRHSPSATDFSVEVRPEVWPARDWRFELSTPLIGEHNVYNCLAAAAVGLSQGVRTAAIRQGIASLRGVIGRMERIDEGQDFLAIVDFAHTPRALEVALQTARRLTPGRVIVVFGCAGLRDVQKRAWMGRIAGELADRVVVTAEDPRTEPLGEIMAEIARGCREAGRREGAGYWLLGDRAEAIHFATTLAQQGDVVIVTGKGHERSMCYGTTEHPWSDHAALRAALRGERLPTIMPQTRAETGAGKDRQ